MTDLVRDLADAIERGGIAVVYQPQVDLESGQIVAVEALCRWDHPTRGVIEPTVFIPLAQDNGLMDDLGAFVIDDGCQHAATWRDEGHRIEVAINISATQLTGVAFTNRLLDNLATLGLDSSSVTLELTEARSVISAPHAASQLSALREEGIGLSVDDFGTGYSSIGQLLAIPATELKIDRSVVQRDDATGLEVLSAMVALARSLGLRIVAEGVETKAELERVRTAGCHRAQGYYIGRPSYPGDISLLLAAQG